MKNINLFAFAASCMILFYSCSLDFEKNVDLHKSEYFFSTERFFQQEDDRLSSKHGFTKYVDFNGQEETMKLDTLNFKKEFIPFIKSDINKVIWIDQYTCDTTFLNESIQQIKCKSLNPKLKTQNLVVSFKDSNPASIEIECMMQKMLLETREYLRYQRDEYYEVKRIQKLKTGKSDSTLVRVTF